RQTSLAALSALPGNCDDNWSGGGGGGGVGYLLTAVVGGGSPDPAPILTPNSSYEKYWLFPANGTEYNTAVLRIDNIQTIGSTCSGCQVPICFVLNEVELYTWDGHDHYLYLTNPLANNFVTWQGGAIGDPGCPVATPALNRTWGQLKSAY